MSLGAATLWLSALVGCTRTPPHPPDLRIGNGRWCALLDGAAWCQDAVDDAPHRLPIEGEVIDIAVHRTALCALTRDRRSHCWHRGDGPQPMLADHQWVQVSAGIDTICAVDTDGALWCWHSGLGEPFVPERVGDVSDWVRVDMDWRTLCGLRAGGQLVCWSQDAPDHVSAAGPPEGSSWQRAVPLLGRICAQDSAQRLWCWPDARPATRPRSEEGFGSAVCHKDQTGASWCSAGGVEPGLDAGPALVHATDWQPVPATCRVDEHGAVGCGNPYAKNRHAPTLPVPSATAPDLEVALPSTLQPERRVQLQPRPTGMALRDDEHTWPLDWSGETYVFGTPTPSEPPVHTGTDPFSWPTITRDGWLREIDAGGLSRAAKWMPPDIRDVLRGPDGWLVVRTSDPASGVTELWGYPPGAPQPAWRQSIEGSIGVRLDGPRLVVLTPTSVRVWVLDPLLGGDPVPQRAR